MSPRSITLNFQEPIVTALNIYIGLIYALLYTFRGLPGPLHWYLPLEGAAPRPASAVPRHFRWSVASLLRLPVLCAGTQV